MGSLRPLSTVSGEGQGRSGQEEFHGRAADEDGWTIELFGDAAELSGPLNEVAGLNFPLAETRDEVTASVEVNQIFSRRQT